MKRKICNIFAGIVVGFAVLLSSAPAQVTTGNVTGRVIDQSGSVVAGARVALISEVHGNRSATITANGSGDYVFADITPDTYTVEVTAPSFKMSLVHGIVVTGGDRVGVPPVTLQVGGTTETVSVTAEATLVQTQSGERSFAIETSQIENLPIGHGNFMNAVAFTPGVNGTTRLGSPQDQNNIMMDGISAMDTGNNGQMLNLNIESVGEVKVLTQGYQAEYGRSSGLQITAVTKSGTNSLHGSAYGIFTNSDWNSRTWANQKNGTPQPYSYTSIYGYSIGGPVVIPKIYNGRNKLFFFYAHQFQPSTIIVNSGNQVLLRVPTALERAGDFSQTLDNNGKLIAPIIDNSNGKPFPNSVIPASRLYAPGVAVLNQYPLPTLTQAPGTSFNYSQAPGGYDQLEQQPVIKVDYNLTDKLRFSGVLSEDRLRPVVQTGSIPGFNDVYTPYPYIIHKAITAVWTATPTTVVELTYGSIENQLTGGGSGGVPVDKASNRNNTLSAFPNLYPDAGVLNTSYYAYQVMQDQKPPIWDGKSINLVPQFTWGSLIGNAPPNIAYPGWLNINQTHDYSASLTKVQGRHTIKAGAYLNHSYKAQNAGFNASFAGNVDFSNNTNNTLDSGFGYSNAALGVFNSYSQASKYIEGSMLYNQLEFYVQDNWKVSNRLTLDYGMRFVHQQPQYDQFNQESNFFPDKFTAANAQVLYVAGCSNGATVCSGNIRNAMNPLTGAIIPGGSAANSQVLIGTPVPGVGSPLDGILQAGHGIVNTNYIWPKLVYAPRFGFAYDVNGKSALVIRGGFGLFYDRPDGNTVFSSPANPPIATTQNLLQSQLQTLGTAGLSPLPVASLNTFEYNAKIPSTFLWNIGVQKSLPLQMVLDVSYVGNHAYNRLGAQQGGTTQLINQVPLGTAYLPQYQDPTLGAPSVPGASAYTTNLLRPYQGLGAISQNTTEFYDTYHSIQVSLTRRFRNGFSLGANYTRGISLKGNTGIVQHYTYTNGVLSLWSNEAAYEKLFSTLDPTPNFLKVNSTWDIPGIRGRGGFLHQITGDWQVSGILTAASGAAYSLGYSYQSNGGSVNITGSPDFGGRVVLGNNLGSGCSGNQFAQFNGAAVTGPTYGSVGMESGINYLRGCPTTIADAAIVRRFHFWKFRESKTFEFRADIFNALNSAAITARQGTATFNNPTSMTLANPEFDASGNILSGKSLPQNAGFGAATGAVTARNIQLQVRIAF
ncbi:MAG TPA: carboxypeptidase regulatory-like domain-containing protein [Bryobacteraceae bacterium]|nr:carboxypeptidase regulatory-like domain-containing protein [Bryobacteraceae bacterium]